MDYVVEVFLIQLSLRSLIILDVNVDDDEWVVEEVRLEFFLGWFDFDFKWIVEEWWVGNLVDRTELLFRKLWV